jgi:hypothetical protein
MKKDRNRNFLSILSRPKADLYDEMDTESPEVEARRRLELRIEQVLGTLVEAAPIESETPEVSTLVAYDFVPLEHTVGERFEPGAESYDSWKQAVPAA